MEERKNVLPLWAIILLVLFSTGVGVLAYHFYTIKNMESMAQASIERIAGEREQSEQAAIAQALRIERLNQGIRGADVLKIEFAVHMAETGKMPASLADLQHEPDWLPADVLTKVHLTESGRIILHFRPELGLDGRVMITPHILRESGEFMGISGWDCVSPDFDFIDKAVPACRYAP